MKLWTSAFISTCLAVHTADARQCLKMTDHHDRAPIALQGRLAVTYVDQAIEKMREELERRRDPRAEKIDSHELGVIDLSAPVRTIQRLTNDLIHQAEVEIAPDGESFLYTQRDKLDDFENHSAIWRMKMDGGDPVRLVGDQPMGVPAWDYPTGESFIFINWGNESGDSKLFTFDLPGRSAKPFPRDIEGLADPEVSYDGKLVVFKKMNHGEKNKRGAEGQYSIYVMNRDGSNLRRLTGLTRSSRYSDHDPVFSLDGKKIFFERYYGPGDWFEASQDRGGNPEHNWWGIVEVDVATKKEKIIAPHDPCGKHFFWLPTVSPDGKYLMYTHVEVWAGEEGRPWTDLWVSEIGGKNPQKVRGSDWVYFFDWTK